MRGLIVREGKLGKIRDIKLPITATLKTQDENSESSFLDTLLRN